jgi:2-phosphosulfolactate phosphatase
MFFDQAEFDLRCEWGLAGLLHLAPGDAVVIVDILSFSTAVDVAVSNGAFILPARWKDGNASCSPGTYSLSPASLRSIPAGTELVLPSPNGSTLSLSAGSARVFTACLRNAGAVAAHLACSGARIVVIPAGERWEDGTLRPSLEDWIGAGAVLSQLPGRRSPEAEMAAAAFEHFRGDLLETLLRSASGRELVERGFRCDVEMAAEFGVSAAVPMLAGERYLDAVR